MDDPSQSNSSLFKSIDEYTRPTRNFIWKHRGKFAIATAVVAIGAAVYYTHKSQQSQELVASGDVDETEDDDDWNEDSSNRTARQQRRPHNPSSLGAAAKPAHKALERSRQLLRVRKQYDMGALHFLPTLKLKISEYVVVANTIQQIRELRAVAHVDSEEEDSKKEEAEERLWDEIKVMQFTNLFVTAYMEVAICLLLRIHVHILARSARSLTHDGDRATTDLDDTSLLDSAMFKILIPGTYSHAFGGGLRNLAALVRRKMESELAGWSVKKQVDYSDLAQKVSSLRQIFEKDLHSLVVMIVLPHAAAVPELTPGLPPQSSHPHLLADAAAQSLLAQIWDVLDSPTFTVAFAESTDTCFKIILDNLRRGVFAPDSMGGAQRRTAGLVSLLPQLKAISDRLLPKITEPIPPEARELVAGSALDSLCVALFDSAPPTGLRVTGMGAGGRR